MAQRIVLLMAFFFTLLAYAEEIKEEPKGLIVRGQLLVWGASQSEARNLTQSQAGTMMFHCIDHDQDKNVRICAIPQGVNFGQDTSYTVSLVFHSDRFFEYHVFFPPDHYDFIAKTLIDRLGQSHAEENSLVQNQMGAQFDQKIHHWKTPRILAQVKKRHAEVTKGAVVVRYLPIYQTINEKPGKAPF